MVSFDALGSAASNSAAAPATIAAEADVPVTLVVPPPTASASIPTPGAPIKGWGPELLPPHSASLSSVAETPTTFALPAGWVGGREAALAGGARSSAPPGAP